MGVNEYKMCGHLDAEFVSEVAIGENLGIFWIGCGCGKGELAKIADFPEMLIGLKRDQVRGEELEVAHSESSPHLGQ